MTSKRVSARLIAAVGVTAVAVMGGTAVRATTAVRPAAPVERTPAGSMQEASNPVDPVESPRTSVSVTERPAVAVLRAWDTRRAEAWSAGDDKAVAALYLPGSSAGRRDAALLRSYRDRGLTVRGMRRQILDVRVLVARPRLVRLRVTDRLVGAYATDGVTDTGLPWTAPATRILTLRRAGTEWLMATVAEGTSARPNR